MKRFLPISILLHGVVLLLLFSWEIPLADRLLPGSIVEVSLVEWIEGKPEGKKMEGDHKTGKKSSRKEDIQGKKKVEATRGSAVIDPEAQIRREPSTQATRRSSTLRLRPEGSSPKSLAEGLVQVRASRAKEERRMEEPKPEKTEPVQKEIREERARTGGEIPAESPVLTAISEEFPVLMARQTPTAGGITETGEPPIPLKAFPPSVFLPSAGSQSGQEGIALGGGGKGSGAGSEGGGDSRFSRAPGASGDGDSVIAEIIRRIEKAKRYPRMARKMGVEGQATVRFKLKGNGRIEKAELLETSGSEILDQASLETVQRAGPLPYKEGWLKVVIVFKIL
jgi:TonB family protein